jgi:hypothetical protein
LRTHAGSAAVQVAACGALGNIAASGAHVQAGGSGRGRAAAVCRGHARAREQRGRDEWLRSLPVLPGARRPARRPRLMPRLPTRCSA